MLSRAPSRQRTLLLALAVGADVAVADPERWSCRAADDAEQQLRQFEFDATSGSARMQGDGADRSGRFTAEHGHLVAVLADGTTTYEVTLGTASGRVLVRQRRADGSRRTVFAGHCRRAEAT